MIEWSCLTLQLYMHSKGNWSILVIQAVRPISFHNDFATPAARLQDCIKHEAWFPKHLPWIRPHRAWLVALLPFPGHICPYMVFFLVLSVLPRCHRPWFLKPFVSSPPYHHIWSYVAPTPSLTHAHYSVTLRAIYAVTCKSKYIL